MRFLKILWITLLFFFGALFLLQNKEVLSQPMTLELDLFFTEKFTSIKLPYYFIVLCSFAAGAVSAIGYLILSRLRLGMELRRARKRSRVLEKELNALRSTRLEAQISAAPSIERSPEGA